MIEPLMTSNDLARYLAVQPVWVTRNYEKLDIPHYTVGTELRFDRSEVDEWLRSHRTDVAA